MGRPTVDEALERQGLAGGCRCLLQLVIKTTPHVPILISRHPGVASSTPEHTTCPYTTMSNIHTPRQRDLQRPSYGTSGISPSNPLSQSTAGRKTSLMALNAQQDPRTPSAPGQMSGELEVGDAVNVPGAMHGIVKFIGSVKGKNGTFVGVELSREFASRGKNDGEVEGTSYFTTSVPGAGIFLPAQRAERRFSPAVSIDSFPGTPSTPSYSTINGQRTKLEEARTPALSHHRFAQSVGPGARPPSPNFKPKRPSLPRPESPFRKQPPSLAPTPARNLSQSTRGTPRPGITPSKSSFAKSTTTRPSGQTPRPYSRTGSRLGNRHDNIPEEDRTPVGIATTSNARTTSTSSVPSFSQPLRSPSRLGSAGGQDVEIQRLRSQLSERDRRLEEQAVSLAEMEQSVKELSAIMPQDGVSPGTRSDEDEQSAAQLRQMLREKNEKISMLTAEFDAHRADFRSTLDSLEMASTETERVYEEQKRDLLAQLAELQELQGLSQSSREDFDQVAQQLKQLEELVAELEEGLEESRRGEAEARGEVEFLRGEVERGRSELKRERDKAAALERKSIENLERGASVNGREMEKKDDEIRGLKAIIHSLSSGPPTGTNGAANADAEEVESLRAAMEDSQREKEGLEREIELLRRDKSMTNGNGHVRNESERTATAPSTDVGLANRSRGGTIKATFAEHAARHSGHKNSSGSPTKHSYQEAETNGTSSDLQTDVYCEMCDSADHDTLDCNQLQREQHSEVDEDNLKVAQPYSPGKENEDVANGSGGKGKRIGQVEEDKWCALCEKDGHLAFDCPVRKLMG